jgi:hypothetical protein
MKRKFLAVAVIALATPSLAQSPVPTVERLVKALPQQRHSNRTLLECARGLHLRTASDDPLGQPPGVRKGRGQNRKGESHQLQGVPRTRGARLYRILQIRT